VLCPRCHLTREFPSEFARISSEVLTWTTSEHDLPDTAAVPESVASPGPTVEAILCLECCTDLRAMMHLLFPGQPVSITHLSDVSDAPKTQPTTACAELGSPKRSK
jgi:hypothetical protein